MFCQNKEYLAELIRRYEQRIFALALYLTGGDRDKAYDVAAASFAEAISRCPLPRQETRFLTDLARAVVQKSRGLKLIPFPDEIDFINLSAEERGSLLMTKRAFQKLSFSEKALLLLRDQLHLPYKNIAAVLGISVRNIRGKTSQVRLKLRSKIEEVLRGEE